MNLAIVIVSYNSYQDIVELLVSLKTQKRYPDSIIVVDNVSPNGDGDRLRDLSKKEHFTFVSAPRNGGFAYGCNIGIQMAKEQGMTHVGFINPDTIIRDSDFFVQLERAFLLTDFSCIGTFVINTISKKIEFGGSRILPLIFYPQVLHRGAPYKDQSSVLKIEPTDYTTGSSLSFSLKTFESVGPLDESYFLYFEETDWCMRMRGTGGRIGIISSTALEHKTSQSVGFRSNTYMKYMIRNYARFAMKWARWYEIPFWALLYVGFWIPGQMLSYLFRKII